MRASLKGFAESRPRRRLAAYSRHRVERLRRDALSYALVARVARLRRISLRDLLQGSRGTGNVAQTRQLAMYLVHVLLSRPQEIVGELFGRDRTTVSHACALIESRRDDDEVLAFEIQRIESEGWTQERTEVRHVA